MFVIRPMINIDQLTVNNDIYIYIYIYVLNINGRHVVRWTVVDSLVSDWVYRWWNGRRVIRRCWVWYRCHPVPIVVVTIRGDVVRVGVVVQS